MPDDVGAPAELLVEAFCGVVRYHGGQGPLC